MDPPLHWKSLDLKFVNFSPGVAVCLCALRFQMSVTTVFLLLLVGSYFCMSCSLCYTPPLQLIFGLGSRSPTTVTKNHIKKTKLQATFLRQYRNDPETRTRSTFYNGSLFPAEEWKRLGSHQKGVWKLACHKAVTPSVIHHLRLSIL